MLENGYVGYVLKFKRPFTDTHDTIPERPTTNNIMHNTYNQAEIDAIYDNTTKDYIYCLDI